MRNNMDHLRGKKVMVTGVKGIAEAVCNVLAMAGVELILVSHKKELLDEFISGLKVNVKVAGYVADITNQQAVEVLLALVKKDHSKIDILINDVQINIFKLSAYMPVNDIHEVFDIDISAAYLVSKLVSQDMIYSRSGKIINISSMKTEVVKDKYISDCFAKGGLKMLTRNLAAELKRHYVEVNAIMPKNLETLKINTEALKGALNLFTAENGNFISGQLMCLDSAYSNDNLIIISE